MRSIEKKVSEELKLTKEEVHKIIMFSYAETERQMKGEGHTFELTGLGTLTFLPNPGKKLKNSLIYCQENNKLRSEESLEILINKLK